MRAEILPILKADVFNHELPAAEANILAADIVPDNDPSFLRIHAIFGIAGILRVARKQMSTGVVVTENLNNGIPLNPNVAYIFDIEWHAGESINFRYSVGSAGVATCANNTGTCTGSPVNLAMGINVITVTGAGTFDITVPAGKTAIVSSSGATIVGSPVTCPGGGVTTVDTGITVGTFNIQLTGDILKLAAVEIGD